MTSQGEKTWALGLMPKVDPKDVTDIISRISDVALVLSDTGKITSISCNPDFVGRDAVKKWAGLQVQDVLNVESVPKFELRLKQFRENSGSAKAVELNHIARDGLDELPMRYSLHAIGSDGDILMLGSDMRPIADMQQQLVSAQIALENDYEAQREHDIRFRVLMESSDTATLLVSVKDGNVVACNAAAEKLLGKPRGVLVDGPLDAEFESKGRADVVNRMVSAASEQSVSPVIAKSRLTKLMLSLRPTLFRGVNGQMLLCKITVAGGADRSLDQLQAQLTGLYDSGVDAIVFVDAAGQILSANDAFPKLADITHAYSLRHRSISEFLGRGSVDVNVMLENARRTGQMRLYATRLVSEHGSERAVEISTTQISAGGQAIFGMIIRDSRRVEASGGPKKQITDVDMQSVIELIGGHSLKDIVARTTDVVEKMCIETAVEMTSNNRVAAAEMLGLSRQSLYVKLRKYGLLSKG
ncbi:transcriptional regulator PpsR [Pseudosulfitobacter koreensis]|uniref:Transcriptional regulator PpsR n=1 Tax=Pseudosulfitobacter koreensis TaxID=2968472 RepID=A0ABT1YWC1_9RHOB|nr:transcriptional regulator PpsR [Pseudosulfitobacter koreense]MCR8825191.1 transcriptional regulator PpsR [Pseudosulfitobacter koreense]